MLGHACVEQEEPQRALKDTIILMDPLFEVGQRKKSSLQALIHKAWAILWLMLPLKKWS